MLPVPMVGRPPTVVQYVTYFQFSFLAVKSHSNKIPLFLIGGPVMQVDLFKRHITRAIAC